LPESESYFVGDAGLNEFDANFNQRMNGDSSKNLDHMPLNKLLTPKR
jgi:hypothetical protein